VRFLELNEIWDWCAQRSIDLDGRTDVASDPQFRHSARTQYAAGQRSGRERAVAKACLRALGPWEECLVWVTLTGVWASGEDWPAYYALRGRAGERRSLETAPGPLFAHGEEQTFVEFLAAVLENAWDAWVLPATSSRETGLRIRVSHDEYVELQSRHAVEPNALAV
jgi:hypothetical protein